MIKQRVFGIGLNYEDLNDHTHLRGDECFKIGAVIVKNTRRIKIMMDSHFPEQDLFIGIAKALHPT